MSLRLFLVRHGESVDNVAGLYAGTRDSLLTNHGLLQAQRLGEHLAARSPAIGPVTHIYASNLQRAARTAQAIAKAQSSVAGGDKSLGVVQVLELREKDFGSDEGKRFGTRGSENATAASSADDFVPSESRDSMKVRVDRFIDTVLVPAIAQVTLPIDKGAILIVAHGIILNVLLSCLLSRFGPDEVTELARPGDAPWRSEWLATWSNTGYLEAVLRVALPVPEPALKASETLTSQSQNESGRDAASQLAGEYVSVSHVDDQGATLSEDKGANSPLHERARVSSPPHSRSTVPIIQIFVKGVNCIEHLQGLKKTRGGIGSAASNSKQRTMDSFFPRPAKSPK